MPRAVDDDALACSARFRQGGRFPVLSYHHAPSGTVSPAPPQTPLLGPTAPTGPFSALAGLIGCPAAAPAAALAPAFSAFNRPRGFGSIQPSPTPAPPLSRVLETELCGPAPLPVWAFETQSLLCQHWARPLSTPRVPPGPAARNPDPSPRLSNPAPKAPAPQSAPANSDPLVCRPGPGAL